MNDNFEKNHSYTDSEEPSCANAQETQYSTDTNSSETTEKPSFSTWQPPAPEQPPVEDPEFRKSGTVAMVLGIIAAALYSCCGVNLILAIISLVNAGKNKRLSPNGRMNGMALAGTICSWCSIGFSVLFWGLYILLFLFGIASSGAFELMM